MENKGFEQKESQSWQKILLDTLKEAQSKPKKAKKILVLKKEKLVLNPREEGLLWFEMLKSLKSLENREGLISLPKFYEGICRKFSITKNKARNCLFFLTEFGLTKMVGFSNIRLDYDLE